jgi:hypothetical protein
MSRKAARKYVDFRDLNSTDVQFLMAVRAGKYIDAAAKFAGLTKNQGMYRLQLARKLGMQISPNDYRRSPNFGELTVKSVLKNLGECDRIIRQIQKHLIKHNTQRRYWS